MAEQAVHYLAFNRGLISSLATSRVDLKRTSLSAETMENWMPRALGSMMMRPGLGYLHATPGNAASRSISFVKSRQDSAILEFTDLAMRVVIDDVLLTRPSVSSAVVNGTFTANINSWTDNDEVGCVSAWVTGGYMGLTGTGTAAAIRDQQVTVAVLDRSVEHALRIVIERGPVGIRVGSTSGGDEYIQEALLETGTHSLSFTPTNNFYIRLQSRLSRIVLVDSCEVEASGVVSITSPYAEANLDGIRGGWDVSQSADVMFLACNGVQQRRVERRGNSRSWAIVLYRSPDGPFRADNTSTTTMTPSVLTGNGTLTASTPTFRSGHVGAIFSVTSTGQTVTKAATALNDATNSIRVTGVGADRTFAIYLTGMTAGRTVILQTSADETTWAAVSGKSWTADTAETYLDGLDNQIVYYRLLVTVAGAAGTTSMQLTISTGSVRGIGRVTAYTSSTVVDIEVLSDFGATSASATWAEGEWSDYRGWPSSVAIYETRMFWAGLDKVWASVTDVYDGYDDTTVGDSGPISRSIGAGPIATINWILPLQRLLLGGDCMEYSVWSSAFDEPLTPSAFKIRTASTQGSSGVNPVRVDNHGMFVQGGGTRLFELGFAATDSDYKSTDLSMLVPEAGGPFGTTTHIVRIGVQRQPDTRIHCVRSDGTAAVLVYDKAENVLCWIEVTSPGEIEDVCVRPAKLGQREDAVYYTVRRYVNGGTVRHFEKWALESECVGDTLNKQADSFIVFSNSTSSSTVTGLSHLIGEEVVVWADGICLTDEDGNIATFEVDVSGNITLTHNGAAYLALTGVVGLPYSAQWESATLGTALNIRKRVDHLGLVLDNTHSRGLRFGPSLNEDQMDYLPLVSDGGIVDNDLIYTHYDEDVIAFPGTWETDARLCLLAVAPRPCTILSAVAQMEVTR
jgi:hypothetical protein